MRNLRIELLAAGFLDRVCGLRSFYRQQLAMLDGGIQLAVLVSQVFALLGDFRAFIGTCGGA